MPNYSRSERKQAWLVLAAAIAMNLAMGFNYSWSVIKKALVSDWHWTNVEASVPYTFFTAIYALAMIIAGRLQDKYGPRPVAYVGCVMMTAGLAASSLATSPLALTLSYGILASLGNATCYATTIPTSVKWFPPARRGAVTGAVVGAIGLGAIYVAPLANWLLVSYGVANTFLVLAAASGLILAVAISFLKTPADAPPDRRPDQPDRGCYTDTELAWRQMLRTDSFPRLWLMLFFIASAGLMLFGHMASIAKTQADWDFGYFLVVLLAACNTAGRLGGGALSDRCGRLAVIKAGLLLQTANLLLFAAYNTPALLTGGAVVAGLTYGSSMALFPLLAADFYGLRNLGVNLGILLSAWGFAGVLGPLLAGWAVDATGTYHLAYFVSAALLALSLVLAYTTKSPQIQAVKNG